MKHIFKIIGLTSLGLIIAFKAMNILPTENKSDSIVFDDIKTASIINETTIFTGVYGYTAEVRGTFSDDKLVARENLSNIARKNKTYLGLDGNDIFVHKFGYHTYIGGLGVDMVDVSTANMNVHIDLERGILSGKDTGNVKIEGIEQVKTGSGDDNIWGNSSNNYLEGQYGMDTIMGRGGDDIINGGSGADTLSGNSGADLFYLSDAISIDTIKDFSIRQKDNIDISYIIKDYRPSNGSLADWVKITDDGMNSALFVDLDGRGTVHYMKKIAILENVTGLADVTNLVAEGRLIVR